jgi:aryl-alcohol dehydrogenase-like predicted oxidoreductase
MQYRTLGRTGVPVRALALGAMNVGALGRTDQAEATVIVDAALAGHRDDEKHDVHPALSDP